MLFRNKYRYWFILGLSLYTYANTAFCNLYTYFNLPVSPYHAAGVIFLITLGTWEISRFLHPVFNKWVTGEEKSLQRKIALFLSSTFVSLLFTTLVCWVFSHYILAQISGLGIALKLTLTYTVLVSLLFHLLNAVFYYLNQYRIKQVEAEELMRMNVQVQLQRIQSQVNPHFLFNNLNVLAGMVMKENDEANKFIESFSKVYYYILHNQDRELIALGKELEFLQPYNFLLKKRFPESLQIVIDIPPAYHDQYIVPAALQMLVENAIKHNIASPGKPLKISITVTCENELCVRNTLQPKISNEPSSKIGLKNIDDRYFLTTGQHIAIQQEEKEFIVLLPIVTVENYAGINN
jgi:two-component system, LytTR family, sensor kinase